jgi:hypothetical protein
MAEYMTITSKHSSWKEYYLSKKKETNGFLHEFAENKLSVLDSISLEYVGRPDKFKKVVEFNSDDENFLLLPAGGNRVSIVHSCFNLVNENKQNEIFGIFGTRSTSPFKRVSVEQAVRPLLAPRVTRKSKGGRDNWLAPVEEFLECMSADEFRDLVAKEEGYPAAELWKYPQSCFVHPLVFEAFGNDSTKRAGDLALEIMRTLPEETGSDFGEGDNDRSPDHHAQQILLFLWAIENLHATKVNLGEAPDSDKFDGRAQSVLGKLNKEEARGGTDDKAPFPSIEWIREKKARASGEEKETFGARIYTEDKLYKTDPRAPPSKSTREILRKTHDKSGRKEDSSSSDDRSIPNKRDKEKMRGRTKGRREEENPSSNSSSSSTSSPSDSEASDLMKTRGRGSVSKSSRSYSGSRTSKTSKTRSRSRSRGSEARSPARSKTKSRSRSSQRGSGDDSSQQSSSGRNAQRRKPGGSPPSSSDDSSDDSDSSSDDSDKRRRPKGPERRKKRKKSRREDGRRKRPRRQGRRPSRPNDERDLHKAMVRSLQAMTESQLKRDEKKDKKMSMLARLPPEAAGLFKLAAAKSWRDKSPKMPAFTKKVMEDRDSNRALGEMKTLSKRWPGRISEKGFLSFLSNGYAADDISEAPGGFSIFMFSPLGAPKSTDQKSRVLQVKSMFGSTELDDESVKYFAKYDFYLADSLSGLEEQIYTGIKCLEKLTCRDGIASEGYWYGFEMLTRYKREFLSLLQMDPLFPVKFAYLLDRAFQNFINELGDFYDQEEPIRKAKRKLKGQQVKDIETAMAGFKTGSLSQLFLPRSLRLEIPKTNSSSHAAGEGGLGGTGGKQKLTGKAKEGSKEKSVPEVWWTTNPNVVAAWKLPEGKEYNDFFDHRKAATKPNSMSWPKFEHHDASKKGRKTYLCVKYQCVGSCRPRCFLSHVDPTKMEAEAKAAVSERFKEIYGS